MPRRPFTVPITDPPPVWDEDVARAVLLHQARHQLGRDLQTDGPLLDLVPDGTGGYRKAEPSDRG